MIKNKWFPFGTGSGNKPVVFCFHFAGGNAGAFRDWTKVKADFEFIPVELPGRGQRNRERSVDNIVELLSGLTRAIEDILKPNQSYALFGHSMGGAIAFDLALELQQTGKKKPIALVVAGRHAPHKVDPSTLHSALPNNELIEELRKLNGTPEEILNNPEMINFLIPMIRADLRLHESFQYNGEQLDIPILAHSAKDDSDAHPEIMAHWEEVANGTFELKTFDGDHFFVQQMGDEYVRILSAAIGSKLKEKVYV